MRIGKIGVAVIGLVPFNVYAEPCTPTPDCADMGYTETSCSGKFVRCPFDTSKLFCTPCDSSFQYDCDGAYTAGGLGSTCGEKYVSCSCVEGATFTGGNCICDTSCSLGNIYYSDGTCSSCIETTKTAIGVVVKDNEVIMGMNFTTSLWSATNVDVSSLTNIQDKSVAKNDYDGVVNTGLIVSYFGVDADDTSNAALFCYNYTPAGLENSKTYWYLPAVGELYDYLHLNYDVLTSTYKRLGRASIQLRLSTSTEYGTNHNWFLTTDNGDFGWISKYNAISVVCFLAI